MGISAKNIIVGDNKPPELPKKQITQTFEGVKAAKSKKSDSKQPDNISKDKPSRLKKPDLINKRKQESQFLSVMKNKE